MYRFCTFITMCVLVQRQSVLLDLVCDIAVLVFDPQLVSLLSRFVFAPSSRVNLQLSWLTNTPDLGDYDFLDLQHGSPPRGPSHGKQARTGAARTNG